MALFWTKNNITHEWKLNERVRGRSKRASERVNSIWDDKCACVSVCVCALCSGWKWKGDSNTHIHHIFHTHTQNTRKKSKALASIKPKSRIECAHWHRYTAAIALLFIELYSILSIFFFTPNSIGLYSFFLATLFLIRQLLFCRCFRFHFKMINTFFYFIILYSTVILLQYTKRSLCVCVFFLSFYRCCGCWPHKQIKLTI